MKPRHLIPVAALSAAIVLTGCMVLASRSSAAPEIVLNKPVVANAQIGNRIYFEENFKNYRDKAPSLIDEPGINIGNDPIWTQSAEADFNLKKSAFVLKQFTPVAENVKNYDVLFKFRLRAGKDQPLGSFQLRLRHDVKGKAGDVIVNISSTNVKVSSEGISPAVNHTAALPFEIQQGAWHDCAVTVKDGRLLVYIDENRVLKQVADVRMPVLASAGINFYATQESQFSLRNIVMRDPAPLPNYSITNLLPAPVKINAAAFKTGVTQTVPANDSFGAVLRTGLEKDAVKMAVNWNDGTKSEVVFNIANIRTERKVKKDGKEVKENYELPEAIIRIVGVGGDKSQLNYHIRPMLRRYHTSYSFTDTYHDMIRDWDLLPKASEHPLKVELRKTAKGIDVYFDGKLAGSLAGPGAKDVTFTLAPTASIGEVFSQQTKYDSSKYLPLDVAALRMAKSFVDANVSVKPGFSDLKGVPMLVASGAGSADIGLTKEGQGNWALEVDEYLARQPFDGLLTEVHFTVPGAAAYNKAWVLCALDPDSSKDPILTTRITRYVENGIGGNRIADTTITLPRGNEKPGEGVVPMGTVTKTDKDGKKVNVPLYMVEVPLNTGKIIDVAMGEQPLNFEFFGKPWVNFEQLNNDMKPDPTSTSAVQVFGVTLEKSPVGLNFVQAQPANIFHNDEKPETSAVLKSIVASSGKLAWEIKDVDGKQVRTGSTPYKFAVAGAQQVVNIPLNVPDVGWYELNVSVQDEAGKTLLNMPGSFALLGKDERKAGFDSPYASWWFDGAHITPKDKEFGGSVLLKAGIRNVSWTNNSEKDLEPWKLTKHQFNMPFTFKDLENPEAAKAKAEVTVRAHLAKYPNAKEVLVFHESGPGNDVPLELFGVKHSPTGDRLAYEKRYADLLNLAGAFFREKFPQLKLVIGNNSASAANVAAILRHGGKAEYIDYIGIEAPSQVIIPEKLQEWAIQGHHIATDTSKVLSGRAIPATACYEFTYRSERDMGQQQQAEWYSRDALISLANNFTSTSPGILFDASNSYYNGLWGGSGILEREPYAYPKKAYVAYATLTNVLDQVKFRRQVPTGSSTVYATEFDRADKKLATALWASRGEADFNIEFNGDTAVRVVDMYGRSKELRTVGNKVTVRGGTGPTYVVASLPIKAITLSNRAFAKDEARAKSSKVAAPLDKIESVRLEQDKSLDTPLVFPVQLPVRKAGEFAIRQANTPEKGGAIEVELKTDNNKDLSKYVTEYATVRLNTPAPIEGNPAAIGVWVDGNSNWGRILFEIEDAQGETWRSIATGGWGCDVLDWPGNISVNFDGWNFVALPFRDTKLFNDHSPGPVSEQWVSSGGNKKMEFPIKVKALTVEMNRTKLDLIDFKPSNPVIRLKDVSGIYD
jgi:hypothetical protein